MTRLVISDLDDTIYPWLDYFVPSFMAMAEEVAKITGIPLDQLLDEYREVHRQFGDVETPYATLYLPSIQKIKGDPKYLLQPAFSAYRQKRSETLQIFPDVRPALQALREAGIRIVGCTEASREHGIERLMRLGVDHLFDRVYVASGREGSLQAHHKKTVLIPRCKPDPLILQSILLAEQCLPEKAVAIGDSETRDIAMAAGCGVSSVLVRRKHNTAQKAARYSQLVRITSWTDADHAYDRRLQQAVSASGVSPDYIFETWENIPGMFGLSAPMQQELPKYCTDRGSSSSIADCY